MRWVVRGLPLKGINKDGGSVGEPFGVTHTKQGDTIVLTKQAVFHEGDEERSSHHHPQVERERG